MQLQIISIIRGKSKLEIAVLKNTVSLFALKGGNILLQLMLVPVSIRYVSSDIYGFWLTISSVVTWLNIMDIGLSNGLRNKLSHARVNNEIQLGKTLVSTTYYFLILIALIGIILFGFLSLFVNWNSFFSVPSSVSDSTLKHLLLIVIFSFFASFVLKPISAVSYSFHKPFIDPLISFIASLVSLVALLLFGLSSKTGNIIVIAMIFCLTPIITNVIISFVLFHRTFRDYKPSLFYIKAAHVKPLLSLSAKFFVIQIAATIVLSTSNFIISKYYGNETVTEYYIVQRYFGVVLMLHSMVLIPYWNLITEAYAKRDGPWLKKVIEKLLKITLAFVILIALMIGIAPFILQIWLKNMVHVPITLFVLFGLYVVVFIYASVFTNFINGTGKVKLQMVTSVFTCLFYIPFILFLIKVFKLGIAGFLIASIIWALIMLPVRVLQYKELIKFSKKLSIWNS